MKEHRIPQKENVNLDAFEEPSDSFAGYSYADDLKWDYEELIELIKGKIFANAAAPNRRHQEVSGDLQLGIKCNRSLSGFLLDLEEVFGRLKR